MLGAILGISLLSACDSSDAAPAEKATPVHTTASAPPAAPAAPIAPKEKVLELPWAAGDVRDALRGGATLVYKKSGTNAKGKAVEDDFRCDVKKSTDTVVGTVCDGVKHPSKDKGATQVASTDWSKWSPFFRAERPEETLIKLESLAVPAGTFDCVNVEIKGFMGASYTAWMIVDKPGVYAKIINHGNHTQDEDKTELTYELAELVLGKAP